jgi:Uma2 family endonuclease
MVRFAARRRCRVPDLLFVQKSRLDLLRHNHLEGPPDVAFEIVSPDSVARDWREKYLEYESVGVHEYWVIDPMSRRAEAYALTAGAAYERIAPADDVIRSAVIPGFFLKENWLWQVPRPRVADVLREFTVR